MYLKRLELQGFKSFPEKIRLEFNKGITAVVGPNGSGKSNIADAVRWVLGEKSAKSLRGAKMEDVIFNGTANRKAMGFAEVSMIMDNSDRTLNMDFSEVTVTRRVYRSGESDYLINGTSCRLKDILELFMDTGVGKEGYSIIGQGRIEEILSTRSEDRRMLFEEAAGIVKYKTRRAEAANKLEKERENLVRVNDIIAELERQVGPLEKEAEKTKNYNVLAERQRLVQVNLFVREADKYEADLNELNNVLEQLTGDRNEQEKQRTLLEQDISEKKADLRRLEEKMRQNTDEIAEKRSEWEGRESDIRLYESEIEHILADVRRIEGENESAAKSREDKEKSINLIMTEIKGKKLMLENKNKLFAEKQAEFDKFKQSVSKSEEQAEAVENLITEKENASTELKIKISGINTLSAQSGKRREILKNDLNSAAAEEAEKQNELDILKKRFDRIEEEGRLIAGHLDEFNAHKQELSSEISQKSSAAAKLTREIGEKNSRLKIISELEKDHEGYYAGVKAILKKRDSKDPDFRGICGAVGEVITMDSRYENAIEIALGAAVQNIIARNDESVKTAIRFLKENNGGRATFLPMTAVKGRPLGNEKHNILKENGVIGIAKELVKYSPEYENIMSNLLDRVIVVDDINNGTDLARKTNHVYKIVTLDGELFNPGGSVTGGSLNKKSAGIFSRGREIAELKDSLKGLLEHQHSVNEELEKAKQKLENTEYKLEEAKEDLQTLAIDKTQAKNNITFAENELGQLKEKRLNAAAELERLDKELENGEEAAKKYTAELSVLKDETDALYEKLSEHQSLIKNDRDIREKFNNEITEFRVDINSLETEIGACGESIERIKGEINDIVERSRTAAEEAEQLNEKLLQTKDMLAAAEKDIVVLKNEYDEMNAAMERSEEQKANINKAIEDISQKAEDRRAAAAALDTQITRQESRAEQTKEKSTALYDRMWNDYNITYAMAKELEQLDIKDADLQKEARSLAAQIRAIGPVNPNAVEEYNNVKERFDFLTGQRSDILESEEKLCNVIVQLEKLMETQFRTQFAVISKNFTDVFRKMFGGGTAELRLADDSDILNCGIDIVAQPPGKKLLNMMLLSGGEKALTAISLLFAILEMKPSPFCILDEIEAALDDANVNRYAEYLKNFTDTTQFVVITHRKGTMEAADILYGVTMQEQGISKLVSVNLKDEEGA